MPKLRTAVSQYQPASTRRGTEEKNKKKAELTYMVILLWLSLTFCTDAELEFWLSFRVIDGWSLYLGSNGKTNRKTSC